MVTTYTTGSWSNFFNDPFFIGFDSFANRVINAHSNTSGFPPYNVKKVDEDNFIVELAVAGYSKDSIEVTEHNGTLVVKGEKPEDADAYIHKGVAGRKFTRTFVLGEYMFVDSAEMKDGMLHIAVKREIPEEAKPKTIAIN